MRRTAAEYIRSLEARLARLEKSAKSHSTDIHKVLKELTEKSYLAFDWIFDPKNYEIDEVHYEHGAPDYADQYKGAAELHYNFKEGINPSTVRKYIKVLTNNKNIYKLISEDEKYGGGLLEMYNDYPHHLNLREELKDVPKVTLRGLRVKNWKFFEVKGSWYLKVFVDIHLEAEPPEYMDSSYYWR